MSLYRHWPSFLSSPYPTYKLYFLSPHLLLSFSFPRISTTTIPPFLLLFSSSSSSPPTAGSLPTSQKAPAGGFWSKLQLFCSRLFHFIPEPQFVPGFTWMKCQHSSDPIVRIISSLWLRAHQWEDSNQWQFSSAQFLGLHISPSLQLVYSSVLSWIFHWPGLGVQHLPSPYNQVWK